MVLGPRLAGVKRKLLAVGTVLALSVGVAVETTAISHAAVTGPCDIYASGNTPCVAAHSTTRALYGSYNSSLYQVRRASDNTTSNIGVLSAGGYANAAAQDSFCAGTSCVITVGLHAHVRRSADRHRLRHHRLSGRQRSRDDGGHEGHHLAM